MGSIIAPGVVPGRPDGATVDCEGHVWNARFGGGCIVRSTPDGSQHVIYPLPVSRPTSCSFGGANLEKFFTTTARQGLGEAELATEPLAGALLAIEPGVSGIAEGAFVA